MGADHMPGLLPQHPTFALLDQLATGIGILDADLCFIHVNPAFIEITGLPRWRACPLTRIGAIAETVSASIQRMRTLGTTVMLRDVMLPACPSRVDMALSTWGKSGVLIELHKRSTLDSESTSKISHTLRGLAHEVKNPLAGLRGAAQLLERRSGDVEQKHLAALIISEADRLAALTDRLLHPGGKPHLSMINLHEVCERACALISAEVEPRVRIERDYDPSLPNLRADADRLLQLLLNLMRNAIQASANVLTVRTRAQHNVAVAGEAIRLAARVDIVDNGCGIPEGLRDTLFLPLVSSNPEGTGIGLALAQEIAAEQAGQLSFRSMPGNTVFSLILPLESSRA